MNTQSLAVIFALAVASGSAFAESYTEHNTPFTSSASRAEVAAQAQLARGSVDPWSTSYDPLAQFRSSKTRAQVTAGYIANRDTVDAFIGEDSGSNYLAGTATGAERDRVAGEPDAAH